MVTEKSGLGGARGATALSLKALGAFVVTVECGNITKAARQLGVTQPAVSVAIQEIESTIGKALIDRSARPLSPTRAGRELYKRAVQVLAEVDRMLVAVRSVSSYTMPSMRLGVAGPMMGSSWVFELQSFADELHVLGGLSIDLQQLLLDRKVDAAVLSDLPMYEVPDIERRQLLEEPFLLVVPLSGQAQWRDATFREMAERLPLIRYSRRTTIGRAVDVYLRRCALEVPRRIEFETSNSVLEMVQAGLGWTITTPLCIAESRIRLSTVAIRPLEIAPAPRRLFLVHHAGELPIAERIRDVLTRSLKDVLAQAFAGEQEFILKLVSFEDPGTAVGVTTAQH
jgi:DNA-binding transcriptional LysR family regulator